MHRQEKLVDIVREIRQQERNKRCADCLERGPQYVCSTFNTFVCNSCSGLHREFCHRVKSISMSQFSEAEVEALSAGGNDVARKIYLARHRKRDFSPPNPGDIDRIRDWIRMKYVDRRWYKKPKKKSKKSTSKSSTLPAAKPLKSIVPEVDKLVVTKTHGSSGRRRHRRRSHERSSDDESDSGDNESEDSNDDEDSESESESSLSNRHRRRTSRRKKEKKQRKHKKQPKKDSSASESDLDTNNDLSPSVSPAVSSRRIDIRHRNKQKSRQHEIVSNDEERSSHHMKNHEKEKRNKNQSSSKIKTVVSVEHHSSSKSNSAPKTPSESTDLPDLLDLNALFSGVSTKTADPKEISENDDGDWADFASASKQSSSQQTHLPQQLSGWEAIRQNVIETQQRQNAAAMAQYPYMMQAQFPGYAPHHQQMPLNQPMQQWPPQPFSYQQQLPHPLGRETSFQSSSEQTLNDNNQSVDLLSNGIPNMNATITDGAFVCNTIPASTINGVPPISGTARLDERAVDPFGKLVDESLARQQNTQVSRPAELNPFESESNSATSKLEKSHHYPQNHGQLQDSSTAAYGLPVFNNQNNLYPNQRPLYATSSEFNAPSQQFGQYFQQTPQYYPQFQGAPGQYPQKNLANATVDQSNIDGTQHPKSDSNNPYLS